MTFDFCFAPANGRTALLLPSPTAAVACHADLASCDRPRQARQGRWEGSLARDLAMAKSCANYMHLCQEIISPSPPTWHANQKCTKLQNTLSRSMGHVRMGEWFGMVKKEKWYVS